MFAHVIKLIPSGWLDHNKVPLADDYQRLLQLSNSETGRFTPENDETAPSGVGNFGHKVIAGWLIGNFSRVNSICASTQTGIGLARIAIALERHRMLHQVYPETLAALDDTVVPDDGLPADVIDGTPAHYKRLSPERFLLYFNGRDGNDNGGKVDAQIGWVFDLLPKQPIDWVWPMPVETQE